MVPLGSFENTAVEPAYVQRLEFNRYQQPVEDDRDTRSTATCKCRTDSDALLWCDLSQISPTADTDFWARQRMYASQSKTVEPKANKGRW